MNKRIKGASAAIAKLLNFMEPPSSGVHVGEGVHVAIPPDWAARIAAGEDVPGCSFARVEGDGSIWLRPAVVTRILSLDISTLPAARQAAATALVAKINAWVETDNDPPPSEVNQ